MTRHPAARISAPLSDIGLPLHAGRPGALFDVTEPSDRLAPTHDNEFRAKFWSGMHGSCASAPLAGRRLTQLALACATLFGIAGVGPTRVMAAPIASAMASLPPSAGRVLAVQDTGTGADFRQRITLSGGHTGANTIEIMTGAAAIAPSPGQINAELAIQFPGMTMTSLPGRVLRSAYGPMHIAIGAPASGGRCIYAWQQVSDLARQAQPTRLFQRTAPASIRIRLCSLNATLDQLAEMSEQLVIDVPDKANAAPAGELPTVSLSPLAMDAPEAEPQPRVMLAQASRRSSGGALLDRSSGNPGGLIGMMRGYRRTDPIQGTRRAGSSRNQASRVYSAPRQQRSSGFGQRPLLSDDGTGAAANQGGLLGNWAARRRMDNQRNLQTAPRRQAAPQRRAAPRRATPVQAKPVQVRPVQARPVQTRPADVAPPRQIQRQQPAAVAPPALPQGYQAPGNGVRYLGAPPGAVVPGAAPQPAMPGSASSGGTAIPQVPRPMQALPGAAAPARPAVQNPAPAGAQPILRGLDPTLPGRAYRGPGG